MAAGLTIDLDAFKGLLPAPATADADVLAAA